MTIHHYGDGLSLVLGPPPAGGYVPLDGTEPNIVLGLNLNNEQVDVTGNHTLLAAAVDFTAAKSYDGERYMAQLPGDTPSRIIWDSGTAHRVPTATAVSFGGMYILKATQPGDNRMLMHSGVGTGAANQNYGLRWKGTAGGFQSLPGAADFTYTVPTDVHFHIVMVKPAGRLSAKLYINGIEQDDIACAAGAMLATNEWQAGEAKNQTNVESNGWASDLFVCDKELSDAEVLTFATNAFGGTPPAAP